MSRGKIIGLVVLAGFLILLFSIVRSCQTGGEVQEQQNPGLEEREGGGELDQGQPENEGGGELNHHAPEDGGTDDLRDDAPARYASAGPRTVLLHLAA